MKCNGNNKPAIIYLAIICLSLIMSCSNNKSKVSHLPMQGGYNFRDLGGIRTTDGRCVKWGKLFRADELSRLTDTDLEYLSSIPLSTIVDFRFSEETTASPDKIPGSVKEYYNYEIKPGNISVSGLETMTTEQADSVMIDIYTLLVSDPGCVKCFRDFFTLLQNDNNAPLLFHCSAGKDRTGLATAFILTALGVDEATILEDYMLSNIYLKDKYAPIKEKMPRIAPLFEVKPDFFNTAMEIINKNHGSLENFLVKELRIDMEKMKDLYLEK